MVRSIQSVAVSFVEGKDSDMEAVRPKSKGKGKKKTKRKFLRAVYATEQCLSASVQQRGRKRVLQRYVHI